MNGEVLASIIGAILGAGGLAWSTKIKTKAGDAASSVESALKLQKRYEDINTNITAEMKTMKEEFNEKINNLTKEFQDEMKDIKQQFEQKENYYKSEIETRDDRIDELEGIIVSKNNIIARYIERGTINEQA